MTDRYPEVEEVVVYMHQRIYEPLSLADLAGQAGYSRYHFARIFKEQMGVSPLYYISALRLQKAKDLLLQTDLRVRDIGMEIGQQSLGTFTTRFTERVGMTPAQFRHYSPNASDHFQSLKKIRDWSDPGSQSRDAPTLKGTITATEPFNGIILVGLFPKPIPEGFPLYGTLLSSLGEFCFQGVHPGVYYLLATSVSWRMQARDFLLPHQTLRARSKDPIIVKESSPIPHQQLTLCPPRLGDPPILISLPLLMKNFLKRVNPHSNR
ncbi:helix-turn-helix transcriptional regulator [Thalassobacillus devorans]|uniref:helix-turn-helix transcriptional regulator n=1 Tax=Thalassobacillus devorans TaxID=279813 RepID=UPI00048BB0D9|nr:helix-turn-helix transcriptional regulator [Thalassobacillus devorans]